MINNQHLFYINTKGIFSGCNQVNPDIDHAVVLMGYGVENGQKYWLIRNSWSPTWGEKGYIRLARFDVDEEVCGIDVTPQVSNHYFVLFISITCNYY